MVKYTGDDLEDHDATGAVIKDDQGRVLMQEHVKYGFWTIPVGKAKKEQHVEEALVEELFEECDITVIDFREIVKREYVYERDGKNVRLISHIYEIDNYSGTIKNKEPHKHSRQLFLSLEEVKKLDYLSDATLLYLEHLGYRRDARLSL